MNYDAKGVAEVMGLAFVRSPPSPSSADASKTSPAAAARLSGDPGRNFVIRVDDSDMLIVEIRADDVLASFGSHGTAGRQVRDFASRRVSSPTSVFIERAVEGGLPRKALSHVAEWLAGGDKAKASRLERGLVPKTTLERRESRLSPQESERTERIARLSVHARRALGTQAEARAFMTAPHPELDGRAPVDAAKTDLGARRVEMLLTALEYGLAV